MICGDAVGALSNRLCYNPHTKVIESPQGGDMQKPVGRPKKHAQFEQLVAGLPPKMERRPKYLQGIGVFRGERGETAFVKIYLPHGGTWRGKAYSPGKSLEIKVGWLHSFSWDLLLQKKADLQGRADRGDPLEDREVPTFSEWAKNWLDRAKQQKRRPDTLEIHVNKHLKDTFGSKRLSEITVTDINNWTSKRLKTAKTGTVKRQFNTLRAILNDAKRAGYIESNPCSHADVPKNGVARQRFLDGGEIIRLLVKAGEVASWLPDLIVFAIHSGMRKSEFCALRWRDVRVIDAERTVVLIPNSKSGSPRILACTSSMKDILGNQEARKVADDERVFPISAMTLRRKWEKARADAGLSDVNIHDLRRTHATHAAVAGVDLNTLATNMGHSDLTMLEKHYAAFVGSAAVEATDKFQKRYDQLTSPPVSGKDKQNDEVP